MDRSQELDQLGKALAAAQAELRPAPMNAKNPFLKNRYADLGSIIDTSRPVLAKHGLSVTQMLGGDANTVAVETVLLHTSGQWVSGTVSLPVPLEKGKSAAQAAGSVITYLRRYGLSAALGMYADEDNDGHVPHQPAQQAPAAPPPTPATEAQRKRMHALLGELGITDREKYVALAAWSVGRDIASTSELTGPEAQHFIDYLAKRRYDEQQGSVA